MNFHSQTVVMLKVYAVVATRQTSGLKSREKTWKQSTPHRLSLKEISPMRDDLKKIMDYFSFEGCRKA